MNRLDLYRSIHKVIRRTLFDACAQVARVDFSSAGEVREAEMSVARLFGYLREHAEHEDRHLEPLVMEAAPELAKQLVVEHARLEESARQIEALWARIDAAVGDQRRVLGAELARRLYLLTADHLGHMDREEADANAVLWGRFDDGRLAQVQAGIVASIPPARLAQWGGLMAASLSAPELAAMGPPPAA